MKHSSLIIFARMVDDEALWTCTPSIAAASANWPRLSNIKADVHPQKKSYVAPRFSASPGLRSVFLGSPWTSWSRVFFALFPKIKKVRHNLRTRGRNCFRTRAHGRRRLMTRPWCLRRRRKRRRSARRTLRWSTWSTTGVCGGASGSLLAKVGHVIWRRRGSSAQGQGEVLSMTVDTWSASVPVLMPYFSFYVKVNSDPEVVGLALWRVGVHAEWRSAHSRCFSFPCVHLEFGQYVVSPLYLAVPVRCLVSAQCLVRLRIHVLRLQDGFLEVFYDFPRDWVDSAPEVDSPVLTGDAPVARLLSLEIWVLFLRASCVFSLICVAFFARVDFLGPLSTHSCECSRAGGAGVAGSLLPGDSAPGCAN